MYISLNWIKDFVNLDGISTDELVKRFGLSTAEVEGVEIKGENISNVVVAEIKEVEDHPNSKKLHILKVDDGQPTLTQVVCSAPNVRVGMKTAFARVGANVNGVKIDKATLAGIDSYGMCCGEDELGIGSDTSGIIELNGELKNGTDIKEVFPIDDVIIEVDNKSLTNRPDLWGHYGIAREFATIFDRKLKPLDLVDLTKYNNLKKLDVEVETDDCYRYSAISVENVSKKVSPQTIKIRLKYCGMRDINLLADLTNYLMLEVGQPMHAFDNALVSGIRVITTTTPTKMLTLEGEEHDIPLGSPIICDADYTPVAIAGVKGGLKDSINENTNSLLLESATFSPTSIRKSSRKIGLITDASLRYEKSLDPELTVTAIARLVYLLTKIDSGVKVVSSLTDVYNYFYKKAKIEVSVDFINKRGGVDISKADMVKILTSLGFKVEENGNHLTVLVPSYRATKDVSIKEDLVEEVLRMYGYDNILPQTMNMPLTPAEQLPIHTLEYKVKRLLSEKFGLNELHSYVWNYKDFNDAHGIVEESVVELIDSSHSGQKGLRSKLLPTTLKIFSENCNSFDFINIFEVGRTFESLTNNLVDEKRKLSIVLASTSAPVKELYFKLKTIVEEVARLAGVSVNYTYNKTSSYFHPVNSCVIESATKVGEMGVIHPAVSKSLDKRFNIAGLELDLDELLNGTPTTKTLIKPSKYQPVDLDFNFVMDSTLPYSYLKNVEFKGAEKLKFSYLLNFNLKDVYKNEEVLKDKTSYTVGVTITPLDKTLEASDIEAFSKHLISHMNGYKIELRA